ncbi:MAG: hypothetical protein NT105_23685 [Verrucomicrobia bacterium]|nr:hypothetical protein [Verrucomicrobiota bacterium]
MASELPGSFTSGSNKIRVKTAPGGVNWRQLEVGGNPTYKASVTAEEFTSQAVRKFAGTYAELRALYLKFRDTRTWPTEFGNHSSCNMELVPTEAGFGELTLFFDDRVNTAGEEQLPDTKRDIVWSFITVDIRLARPYKGVTPDQRRKIEEALEQKTTPDLGGSAGEVVYTSQGPVIGCSIEGNPAKELYNRLLIGLDSFQVAIPVITVTTYHRTEPGEDTQVNRIVTPPSVARAPSRYVYRVTGSATRQEASKVFAQEREYTGNADWPRNLYVDNEG